MSIADHFLHLLEKKAHLETNRLTDGLGNKQKTKIMVTIKTNCIN